AEVEIETEPDAEPEAEPGAEAEVEIEAEPDAEPEAEDEAEDEAGLDADLMDFLIEENISAPPGGEFSDVSIMINNPDTDEHVLSGKTKLGEFTYQVGSVPGDWLPVENVVSGSEDLPPASPRIQRIREASSKN
ncbi:hypothetical protein LCGC14_0508870, partial [marine sediment metagenome]